MGCCQSKPDKGLTPSSFRDIKRSSSNPSIKSNTSSSKSPVIRRRRSYINKYKQNTDDEPTSPTSATELSSDDTKYMPSIGERRKMSRNRSWTQTSHPELTDDDAYSYTEIDAIYRGQTKHAIIIALNFYSTGRAFVNSKVNQVTSMIVKYCKYNPDNIKVINNDTLDESTLSDVINQYLSDEPQQHYFITVITDHPLPPSSSTVICDLSDDESGSKTPKTSDGDSSKELIIDADNIPTDDFLCDIVQQYDNASFFFLLDSPILGVMPRLKYRLINNDVIESDLPQSNEMCYQIYSVMSISSCIKQSDDDGSYVSSYHKADSQLIDELAKLMTLERIESYNWVKLALKLQKIITKNKYTNESISISSNQRDFLIANVSL